MQDDKKPLVISTLQMEYVAMRQELRETVNSMDTNLYSGIALISLVTASSGVFNRAETLYLIPTLLFCSATIQFLKVASSSMQGAYCQVLEMRIKRQLGSDEVLLDWEGGLFFKKVFGPTGLVTIGFYLVGGVCTGVFWTIAYLAFDRYPLTLLIHAIEFAAIIAYGAACMRWSTWKRRKELISLYEAPPSIGGL